MPQFVHLHVHTQYSILDGQASVQRLVDKAMADGQPGIAVTDHGDMFGIKEFYNYVQKVKGKCKDKAAEAEARTAALRESAAEVHTDPAGADQQNLELLHQFLLPKIALPIRTSGEPQRIAVSKSPLIPIDSNGREQ